MSSGEHSLAGTVIAGTTPFSGKSSPPGRGCYAGGNIPKDDHLRPWRLRRTTAARKSPSSGEHSLAGAEIAGTTLFSDKSSPPGRGFPAGGNHPKRSSPPTTAASPEFGRPPSIHLRRAFSPRRWATRHYPHFRRALAPSELAHIQQSTPSASNDAG